MAAAIKISILINFNVRRGMRLWHFEDGHSLFVTNNNQNDILG